MSLSAQALCTWSKRLMVHITEKSASWLMSSQISLSRCKTQRYTYVNTICIICPLTSIHTPCMGNEKVKGKDIKGGGWHYWFSRHIPKDCSRITIQLKWVMKGSVCGTIHEFQCGQSLKVATLAIFQRWNAT